MSKDVKFAKLDKDFALIKDGTTLIQRTILSMACHFPDGMRYDNIALGKFFQVSDNRISHLVNDLDKKGFTKILLPRSKYRIIYLNPDNSTLVKIAKYHENDPDLHCSKQPSTKCLHCYFHQSTLVKTANSIKEVIKVKDNKGDSLNDSEKDLSKQPTESKSLSKSEASKIPAADNGEFDRFWEPYPNKVAKEAARKAWAKLKPDRERDSVTTLPGLYDVIQAAIIKQKAWRENANGEFRPGWAHPATWLNGFRWNDEIGPTNKPREGWV